MDSFIAASGTNTAHPEPVEGHAPTLADAESGMAQMSEKFRETGSEIYVGAGGREHD